MSFSKRFMTNYKTIDPVNVHLADEGVVQAIGSGDIVMMMKTPSGAKKGVLTNVCTFRSYHVIRSRSADSPRMPRQ